MGLCTKLGELVKRDHPLAKALVDHTQHIIANDVVWARNYRHAARYPWVPVEPEPPWPA